MAEDYKAFLSRLDHPKPEHAEAPPGFDHEEAYRRFAIVVDALKNALEMSVEIETGAWIQDASFHSLIRMDSPDKKCAVILFSNFADMAGIANEATLPREIHNQLKEILASHGYLYIPEDVLEETYTGDNPGVSGFCDWWQRFFDYI